MVQYLGDVYEAVSSALKGMRITIKHIWKKPVTLQYPDERWVMPERFRGFVHNDMHRCNGCGQCAKACPVSCIYLETEGKAKERQMTRYAIDYNKCIWCGLCCDPCPHDALEMSHDYDHSVYFRDSFVYEYIPEDGPIPCHKSKRLELGLYVPPEKPKAEKPKKEKPAAEPAPESPAPEPGPEPETKDGDDKGESQ